MLTAWLAPLPPGIVVKCFPKMVCPGEGMVGVVATRSMLMDPMTTMPAGWLDMWSSEGWVDFGRRTRRTATETRLFFAFGSVRRYINKMEYGGASPN